MKANSTSENYHFLSDNPVEAKIMIAMTLAFIVGLLQVNLFMEKFKIRLTFDQKINFYLLTLALTWSGQRGIHFEIHVRHYD